MFTGIVEGMGTLEALKQGRLRIRSLWDGTNLHIGQSVAVDGCCLTIVSIDGSSVEMDVSPETLARTTLGDRKAGDKVNLERGLRLGEALDGHLVTGHIDGVGTVRSIESIDDKGTVSVSFDVPKSGLSWLVTKGSVSIDGVSLTVNSVDRTGFSVVLIPHTLSITTLGVRKVGSRVNLEFDLVAKYIERMLEHRFQRTGKEVLA